MSKDVQDSSERWGLLSQLALASAGVLGILSCLFLLKNPEHISWSLRLGSKIITDLFVTSLFCTNFIGSVVYLMNELRLTTIFTTASCVFRFTSITYPSYITESQIPQPVLTDCF